MKAFLSHSSKDKDFVEAVANELRPGTYELDSETFDPGLLNSETIINALRRVDMFCLFLSESSVQSSYVDFETKLSLEFIADGTIKRFLVICLDNESFDHVSQNVRLYNFVKKGIDVGSTARLIMGMLTSIASTSARQSHPFIGRENDLIELEKQVTDHSRPESKAILISGNVGSGRKAIGKKFYSNQYPRVGQFFPIIEVDSFAGLEEFYRKVLFALRPALNAKELRTRIQSFQFASSKEKHRQIGELINSLLSANEAAFLVDTGGIIAADGAFEPEIDNIISELRTRPHPPLVIVANRIIPRKHRRKQNDISYLALSSLPRDACERLITRLVREQDIEINPEQLDELFSLSDGHPYNIYRLIDEVADRGVPAFLANPSDFLEWKHRQSSNYINKIEMGEEDILILGLLKILPELDFTAITDALPIEPAVASDALYRLMNLHIIESPLSDTYLIAPALRIAVERDKRIVLPQNIQKRAILELSGSLSVRIEEGTAPIELIDTAIYSTLESGKNVTAFAGAFLLPSHYVWLCKRHYDQRLFKDSIRLANEALSSRDRLSTNGFITACRYLCLAAARLGEQDAFHDGITKLKSKVNNEWAKSNIAFLEGFRCRLLGHLKNAEDHFRKSYELSLDNQAAARELASICLVRHKLEDAEYFAREAHSHASSNPYLLDILIAVLIRRHGTDARYTTEISDLLDNLEKVGDEGGKSLFTTRKAEFEYLWGDNKKALALITDAARKTPHIFEIQRLMILILLKDGNKAQAAKKLEKLKKMVNSDDITERKGNYRAFLETSSEYLQEVGRFQEAKNLFQNNTVVFTKSESETAVKEIEIAQTLQKERGSSRYY